MTAIAPPGNRAGNAIGSSANALPGRPWTPAPQASGWPGPAPAPSPRPRALRPFWRDAVGAATWASMLFVVALWVAAGNLAEFSTPGGALTALGRLTGLVGSDLLLIQVLLMARIPVVEQAYGQDELTRRHRLVGFTSFTLMLAHIGLIWLGYAAAESAGLWSTIVDLILNDAGMLLALAGTIALCMVVATSVRKARRRLRYESWHLIHLYAYLGAGLALPHQLWTGQDFIFSPVATVFWWGLWIAALVAVLVFRVTLPLLRSARHRLVVVDVRPVGPRATAVTMAGRDLHRLPARAGQFFQWRFLSGPGASRAHPYSLSAAPDGRALSVTIGHLGDGSAATARLRPGTKVLIEGPYGRLHEGVRTRQKVLLMAGGVGITPLKALLESLDQRPGDVTLVHRVHSPSEALWRTEIAAAAAARGARVFTVAGPRIPGRSSWLPATAGQLSDVDALRQLVPDVADHDVFLCGSPAWMAAARAALLASGVPARQIHSERFTTP